MFAVEIGSELPPQASDAELESLTIEAMRHWETESSPGSQPIPPNLDHWAPGPALAAVLSSIAPECVAPSDRVNVLRARARQVAHEQSGYYRSISAVADAEALVDPDAAPEDLHRAASTEIAAALTLTRRKADLELDLADDLARRLPAIGRAMAAGRLDLAKARVISHNTTHLSDDDARQVADQIVDVASSLSTGQLAARLRKMCIEVDPDEAAARYETTLADRRLHSEMTVDGTANLMGLDVAPHHVMAIRRRINRMARKLRRQGEPRTMDQLRADVFVDLLLGRHDHKRAHGGASSAGVNIKVDLTTLAALDDNPGELEGFGPVNADIARQVAAEQVDGTWTYTVTHNGRPVATGTTSRRPTTAMTAHLQALHPTCVFPGCRMPSIECDLDHHHEHAHGGVTCNHNLGPVCRYHHVVKTNTKWSLTKETDGTHLWTSPLGHLHPSRSPP